MGHGWMRSVMQIFGCGSAVLAAFFLWTSAQGEKGEERMDSRDLRFSDFGVTSQQWLDESQRWVLFSVRFLGPRRIGHDYRTVACALYEDGPAYKIRYCIREKDVRHNTWRTLEEKWIDVPFRDEGDATVEFCEGKTRALIMEGIGRSDEKLLSVRLCYEGQECEISFTRPLACSSREPREGRTNSGGLR